MWLANTRPDLLGYRSQTAHIPQNVIPTKKVNKLPTGKPFKMLKQLRTTRGKVGEEMNKKMFACSLVVFLVVSVVSSSQAVGEEKRGPYLDVIRMETRTSMETGIGDVAAGKLDMFLFPAPSK
ncbi:MAG: hypothetical protein DRO11_07790, partial [Methanobacteriota archaeon]